MPIGPLAELAIYRARVAGLVEQVDYLRAVIRRRLVWPIGFLFGFMAGAAATGLYFVLVA